MQDVDDEVTLVVEERHAPTVEVGVPEELHTSGNSEGVPRLYGVGVGEQQLQASPRRIRVGVDDGQRPLFFEVGEVADALVHLANMKVSASGVAVRERCG